MRNSNLENENNVSPIGKTHTHTYITGTKKLM